MLLFCLSPYGSPVAALGLGLLLALTAGNPFPQLEGRATKILLQASVVLLGFGMNIESVIRAGREGILFTVVTIFGTLLLGYFVGRALNVAAKTSTLISSGTAICGGSAIAAVAPVIDADSDEISVSLGIVFILNSIALFTFPVVGHLFALDQNQFGIWAAIAIHDTSSVVGASQLYGPEATTVATTVKLARALWIAPVALLFLYVYRGSGEGERAKIAIPWFVFLFIAATLVRSYAPAWAFPSLFDSLVNLAKTGMTVTLFLIGASLSRSTLRKVGLAPMMQGLILWTVISIVSLAAVLTLVN